MTLLGLFVSANQAIEKWAWANLPLLLLTGSAISFGTATSFWLNALTDEVQAVRETVEQKQRVQDDQFKNAIKEKNALNQRMDWIEHRMNL